MIYSILARKHHWPPRVLGGLFFDREDINGLLFWHDDHLEVEQKTKEELDKLKLQQE